MGEIDSIDESMGAESKREVPDAEEKVDDMSRDDTTLVISTL